MSHLEPATLAESLSAPHQSVCAGLLIVNGDDWGKDRGTTDKILECVLSGTVSSASAMMFMEDSERAAAIAREKKVDVGLHLNLTSPFSATNAAAKLVTSHARLSRYLSHHRMGHIVFNPSLVACFKYVVDAQLEEFERLYGSAPKRIDGHHHAHLCANVLFGRLLPAGTVVRRNFSFRPGEKSLGNRMYRKTVDYILSTRHALTDFFFSLSPMQPAERLDRIIRLARNSVVELETHPADPAEYRFLGGEFSRILGDVRVAPRFLLPQIQSVSQK